METALVKSKLLRSTSPPNCNIIYYWSQHQKVYLSLALMARCYLGIPATSALSEHVLSQSKDIIGSQNSLSVTTMKHLL
ncbi:uncharacterized protein VP01_1646g3 [Puccinia sorghi]|uniref:HAT C-terminal dimerisation domain-containing protein n=1 Tax=Puccinia sorghi TaxID=27349 RepID=A0A0L6VH76_9BASI|nr:uncharacterized protein VP01_1646g3 [Puccinia sorghi]